MADPNKQAVSGVQLGEALAPFAKTAEKLKKNPTRYGYWFSDQTFVEVWGSLGIGDFRRAAKVWKESK